MFFCISSFIRPLLVWEMGFRQMLLDPLHAFRLQKVQFDVFLKYPPESENMIDHLKLWGTIHVRYILLNRIYKFIHSRNVSESYTRDSMKLITKLFSCSTFWLNKLLPDFLQFVPVLFSFKWYTVTVLGQKFKEEAVFMKSRFDFGNPMP